MATIYDTLEDAIRTRLLAEGSPFNTQTLKAYGASLSDAELAAELQEMIRVAPAGLVFYGGGSWNKDYASQTEETVTFTVVMVAAGASAQEAGRGSGARTGLYGLLEWCRQKLNGYRINGLETNLYIAQTRRLTVPGQQLSVAAYAVDCEATIIHG